MDKYAFAELISYITTLPPSSHLGEYQCREIEALMLDRRTATWAERKAEKEALDAHFLAKRIGEPTYILSLQILGFRETEAKAELNYIKGLK